MSPAAPPMDPVEVLVVEDEEGIRSTVAAILRLNGYSVSEAEDGDVALDILNRHPFEVMVLDVRMPKRDGVSVLEALDRPPAVVLMSAHSLDADDHERIEHKVFAMLKKPFRPERLVDVVAAAAARTAEGS